MTKLLARGLLLALVVGSGVTLLALQQGYYGGGGYGGYRGYRETEEQKDEFAFARLRYPVRMASYGGFGGFGMFPNGGLVEGFSPGRPPLFPGVSPLYPLPPRPLPVDR